MNSPPKNHDEFCGGVLNKAMRRHLTQGDGAHGEGKQTMSPGSQAEDRAGIVIPFSGWTCLECVAAYPRVILGG